MKGVGSITDGDDVNTTGALLLRTRFVKPNQPTFIAKGAHPHLSLRGAQPLMVSLSNHVAIPLRLSTRRQTAIATATRLPPPYQVRGRNDRLKRVRVSGFTVTAWVWAVSVVLESPNGEWNDFYLMRSNNFRINPIGSLET